MLKCRLSNVDLPLEASITVEPSITEEIPPLPSEEERSFARTFYDRIMMELSSLEDQAVPSLAELAEACRVPNLRHSILHPFETERYSRLFRCDRCNVIIFESLRVQHEGSCSGGRVNKRRDVKSESSPTTRNKSMVSEDEERPLKRTKWFPKNGKEDRQDSLPWPPAKTKLGRVATPSQSQSESILLGDNAPLSPVLAAAATYRKGRSNIDRRRREVGAIVQKNPENGNKNTFKASPVEVYNSKRETGTIKLVSQNLKQWSNTVKVVPATTSMTVHSAKSDISASQYMAMPTTVPNPQYHHQQHQQMPTGPHGQLPYLQVGPTPIDGRNGAGNITMPPARLQRRGNQLVLLPTTQTRIEYNGIGGQSHNDFVPYLSLGEESWRANGQQYMVPMSSTTIGTGTTVTTVAPLYPHQPRMMPLNNAGSGQLQVNHMVPGYQHGHFQLPRVQNLQPSHGNHQQSIIQQTSVEQPVEQPRTAPSPWWAQ